MGGSALPLLRVERVSKSYGSRKALEDINVTVRRGEFVALLGPNGAGKTTLFQLLTGLFAADSGSIRIQGHDIRQDPVSALAGIGIVFQQPTLDLDLSVQANLRFHARLQGMASKRARTRIAEELARVGLTEQAGDQVQVRKLSGGNRRKVELARALVHQPTVLLMDEATVGLDPASRRQLLDYVLELCSRRGVGALWATHLVDEAEAADRVLVLHQGRILWEGRPAELAAETGVSSLTEAFLNLTGWKMLPTFE